MVVEEGSRQLQREQSRNVGASQPEVATDVAPGPVTRPDVTKAPLWRLRLPSTMLVGDVLALTLAGQWTGQWAAVMVLYVLTAWGGGLYRSRLSLRLLDEIPSLLTRLVAAAAVVAIWRDLVHDAAVGDNFWRSTAQAVVALALARGAVYAAVTRARSRRLVNHPTLIVGTGPIGHQLAQALEDHPEYGLRPVGFYDPDPKGWAGSSTIDEHDALETCVRSSGAKVVIVAFPRMSAEQLVGQVRACAQLRSEIFYVPRLFDLHSISAHDVDDIWGLPLVRLRREPLRSVQWQCKRVLDVVVSSTMLVALGPIMAGVALMVLLAMGRPIIFRQRRVSLDNRSFWIWKFRTLPNQTIDLTDTAWSPVDLKPGRVGAFLRATSLDELPQLLNVLRGDMSLVGPRPEREHYVRKFSNDFEFYADRHRVPAGLTGLAQIHGLRGDTSIDERARFDNAYVERWSLGSDIKILLRTPIAALRWRGK